MNIHRTRVMEFMRSIESPYLNFLERVFQQKLKLCGESLRLALNLNPRLERPFAAFFRL